MRQPSVFDITSYVVAVIAGLALILLARWAARRRGTRWESLVALRVGDVLLTEVIGAFLIGYGLGSIVSAETDRTAAPGGRPPVGGRFGGFRGIGMGDRLPFTLAIAFAAIAALIHIDIRDVLLGGRSMRNALKSYIGWEARVVAAIAAGGFGEIALRDATGNIMSVSATADVDIPEGSVVRVVGTRELNLVVAPLPPTR